MVVSRTLFSLVLMNPLSFRFLKWFLTGCKMDEGKPHVGDVGDRGVRKA